MSLLARLQEASKRSEETVPLGDERTLIPLGLVEGYLSSHILVHSLSVSVSDVHSALVEIHRRVLKEEDSAHQTDHPPKSDQTPKSENPPKSDHRSRCFECNGYLELDAHEGHEVCINCGLVQTRGSINIEPEFMAPPDVNPRGGRRSSILRGVPKNMFYASLSSGGEKNHSQYREELEHFNAYIHLSLDELNYMDRLLGKWTTGGLPRQARVIGALLYIPLKEQFKYTAKVVRGALSSNTSLTAIEAARPTPQFPCPSCHTMCFTGQSARFHCRLKNWGKRKR